MGKENRELIKGKFVYLQFILYLCPRETKCVDISAEQRAEKGELFCIF